MRSGSTPTDGTPEGEKAVNHFHADPGDKPKLEFNELLDEIEEGRYENAEEFQRSTPAHSEDTVEELPPPTKQGERFKAEFDELLDEIDEVLEDDAEEFVRSYVQKGHQGWSAFTDPSFFVGAATASLLAAVGWDGFKAVVGRAVRALRHVPGGSHQFVRSDGSLDPYFQQTMREAWNVAEAVVRNDEPKHTIDEAMALHWTLFFIELQRSNPVIRVDPGTLEQVRLAVERETEQMSPSELVDIAVRYWMMHTEGVEVGRAPAKKAPARKSLAKKAPAKKAPAKAGSANTAPAKKTLAKAGSARKAPAKAGSAKTASSKKAPDR